MSRFVAAALLLLLIVVPCPADGASLYTTKCAACHGEDGHARIPGAPNLAGQPYQYLLQALHAYRSGERNVPVMRAAAGPLTEKDMQALARWFAAQSPCKPTQAENP